MSLTRFSSQVKQAFFLLVEQPGMLARIGIAWFVLALTAQFLAAATNEPIVALIAALINGLAFGAFGYHWQRFVALGIRPVGPVSVGVNLKLVMWALAYQLLLTAEAAPVPLLLQIMGDSPNAAPVAQAGQQVFQVLIGGLFLLLPHLALYQGDGRPSLVEMALKGGLAVGLGYVLSGLPFLIASHLWKDVVVSLPATQTATMIAGAVQILVSFAALAVSSAYFALVWAELRKIKVEE